MRKRTLTLDKELLTSNNAVPVIDGGTTPSIVFITIVAITMLWDKCPTSLESESAQGAPDTVGADPDTVLAAN